MRQALNLLTLLLLPASGWAQEPFPIDIEMARPSFSPDAAIAVESPRVGPRGSYRVGGFFQYERSPLRLFEYDALVGRLVAHRSVLHLGIDAAVSNRVSLFVQVPIAAHVGSDVPEYATDGVGIGDIRTGLRWQLGTWDRFSLGLLVSAYLPSGNQNLYMGERLPRLRAGALGLYDLGRLELLGNFFIHVREPVETELDFTASSELELNLAVRYAVTPERFDVIGELVTRLGIGLGDFGGRVASELLIAGRYQASKGLRVDFGGGRGITEGYGTTSFRLFVGLTYVRIANPPDPPPPSPEVVVLLPERKPPPTRVVIPKPANDIARLDRDQIIIRDPIQFEQGTTVLKASSDPVLQAVASLIADTPAIGHVVIEGHASEEGSFAFNYALSVERAREIYEHLILKGVHPDRMSYRGMGEVQQAVRGDDPASMSWNRRVVFQVVKQYMPGEDVPVYPNTVQLPWSGETQEVIGIDPPADHTNRDLLEGNP